MDDDKTSERSWDPTADFRGKATYGVAITALAVLLPIAIFDLLSERIHIGVGSLLIVSFLATNAWMIRCGRCHQNLTLFGLVPAGMIFMMGVIADDGIIGSLWCYPSIVACYCMLSERRAWMANIAILGFSLPIIFQHLRPEYAYRICATLLAVSFFSAIMVHFIDKQQSRMHKLLIHDPLTGLLNRFTLKACLNNAIENNRKQRVSSSILAIDIDHFKSVNDDFGHDVGDRALSMVSRLILANIRDSDSAFRSGGEEFLIVLKGVNEQAAKITAHRLLHRIELADIVPNQSLTISIGLATTTAGENWTQWIKRADESLYEAKKQGRNRVFVSTQNRHQHKNLAVLPLIDT